MADKPHHSPRKVASPSNGKKQRRSARPAISTHHSLSLTAGTHASTAAAAARAEADRAAIRETFSNSTQKAAKTFEHFSLSKFAKEKRPANFVDPKVMHDPKAVQDVQRKSIEAQLRKLPHAKNPNSGVRITFATGKLDEMKKAVPGLSEKGGDVKVDALLALLGTRMNGRSFFTGGNRALKRLTIASQARDRAKAIIEQIKSESRANGAPRGKHAAEHTTAANKRSHGASLPETRGGSRS
jgi:hypothetical protein